MRRCVVPGCGRTHGTRLVPVGHAGAGEAWHERCVCGWVGFSVEMHRAGLRRRGGDASGHRVEARGWWQTGLLTESEAT